MSRRYWATDLLTPVSVVLLASCAQPSSPPHVLAPREAPAPSGSAYTVRPRPAAVSVGVSALELQERERAQSLVHEGRWAEAATHWEILLLLRPDQQDYVKALADVRAHASHAAAEHLQEAEQARRQGQTNRAATLYLKALSADPANDKAAQALRDIEKERARKANFAPLSRASTGEIALNHRRSSKPAASPSTAEGRELDAAILLLHQGDDFAAGLQKLETYAQKNPNDDLSKRALQDTYVDLARQRSKQNKKEEALAYLERAQGTRDSKSSVELTRAIQSLRKEIAEDYYQQGLRAQPTNLSEAIRLWEKALKSDPEHAEAARQLERARKMERNLRSMQDVTTKP